LASSRITSNGPDFADVAATMAALEEFHNSQITITLSLPEQGRSGLLHATAKAARKINAPVVAVASVSRSHQIGSREPTMVAAGLFRLLYALDLDCGQMWSQEELFK